jgi:hypothetical protein
LTVEVQDVNGNLVSSAGLTVDFIATVSSVPRIDPFNSLSTTDARETVVGGLVELLVTGVSDGPVTVTVEDLAGSLNVGSTNFTVVP